MYFLSLCSVKVLLSYYSSGNLGLLLYRCYICCVTAVLCCSVFSCLLPIRVLLLCQCIVFLSLVCLRPIVVLCCFSCSRNKVFFPFCSLLLFIFRCFIVAFSSSLLLFMLCCYKVVVKLSRGCCIVEVQLLDLQLIVSYLLFYIQQ